MSDQNVKQAVITRRDLLASHGKEMTFVSLASNAFLMKKLDPKGAYKIRNENGTIRHGNSVEFTPAEMQWLYDENKKIIVLQVKTYEDLHNIAESAILAGLNTQIIDSNDQAAFGEPLPACVAIGPDYSEKIDTITKGLPLR